MKDTLRPTSLTSWAVCALLGSAALLAGPAQAQTVYRLVGPDGKVTFSDKPPAASGKASTIGASGKTQGNGGATLPFELRQVANKYPVTLYTASNCAPCASGRALLNARGIPFTEKTVNSPDDSQALQRISGDSSLPFLTIGGQQIKGYSDSEWTQFLDAAGYPKTSMLPTNFKHPPATPLVVIQTAPPPASAEESQSPRAPATPAKPPVDNKSNPAGISF
jgi:glutaredoxin